MKILALLAIAVCITTTANAAPETSVSVDDVLSMAAQIPPEQSPHSKPAGFHKSPDAQAVAAGIAANASSREEAALMVVYAAYESGLSILARGDGGKSRGPFQLKYVPDSVAYDPTAAAHYWLYLAGKSRELCSKNPEDEQLASLASGYCNVARTKVRLRAETARRISER
jgi:hypothetical protein